MENRSQFYTHHVPSPVNPGYQLGGATPTPLETVRAFKQPKNGRARSGSQRWARAGERGAGGAGCCLTFPIIGTIIPRISSREVRHFPKGKQLD
jgi:hypothetical protein